MFSSPDNYGNQQQRVDTANIVITTQSSNEGDTLRYQGLPLNGRARG